MDNYKKRMQVMAYLTRKPVTPQDIEIAQSRILKPVTPLQVQATSIEEPETNYQTEVAPEMVVPPQDVLPKNAEPVMPWSQGIPNPQARQLELATGGVVNRESFKFGNKEIKEYVKDKKEVTSADLINELKKIDPTKSLDAYYYHINRMKDEGILDNVKYNVVRFGYNQRIKDIAFEINKRNELGLLTSYKELGKKFNLSTDHVWNLASENKIPKLLTKEEAVKKYIEDGLTKNKDVKSFTFGNIAEYLSMKEEGPSGKNINYQSSISHNTVSKIIKENYPELYNLIVKESRFINTNERIQNIPIKDFMENLNKIKNKTFQENVTSHSKTNDLRILKGKLNLGPKDFAISQAQDNYVKQLNESIRQQVNEIGYDEWVKRNPDLVEYAGTRLDSKTGKFIQRSPEEIQKYIDNGFFSIDHKNRKSGEKINIEYPTNKQIVPTGVNMGLIRSSQKYIRNNIDKYGKDLNTTETINNIVNKAKKFDFTIGMDEVPNYQGSVLSKNFKGVKNIGGTQYPTVAENVLTGFDEQIKKFNLDTSTISKNVILPTQEELLSKRELMKTRIQDIENVLNAVNTTPREETSSNEKIRKLKFEALEPNSPLRKAIGYFPGTAVPLTLFDAVTLPLAGYSIPETATIAAQNLLKNPYIAGAANLVTQGYMTSKEATDKTMMDLANERRETLEQGITNAGEKIKEFFKTKQEEIPSYSESSSYAIGGRVKLKNGTDETYNPEIPSLGETDPIGILEQRLLNSKDINEIMKLLEIIKQAKEEKAAEEKVKEEYKIAQKEKGIRYKEDFPSEAAYFAETGKQLLTNPKYFLGKGLKGAVEGTEWLVGQPMKTLFSQEGKNWELYHPIAGEKLGINKYIEENIPKGATTGTLLAGDVAEIAGTFLDPFLAYGIIKGATTTAKTKAPITIEEKIDPTRRDILKTGAILTGGAIVYPTAKKLGLLDAGVKATKTANAVRVATHHVVDNMPEFFPYLSEFSRRKGKIIGEDYMRSGMTEFKREITIPLELNTIGGGKTNVKFEFIHNPADGNVTAYYTNPLTDEKHMFDFYTGKQGKQRYGIDPEIPNASEFYTVEVEPPGFYYKSPNKADPYRKDYEYYDTATEGDDVIKALDKWYKGLSKEEKAKFENRFVTHSEYADELPSASYENTDENYPIMDFMYPKKKND